MCGGFRDPCIRIQPSVDVRDLSPSLSRARTRPVKETREGKRERRKKKEAGVVGCDDDEGRETGDARASGEIPP